MTRLLFSTLALLAALALLSLAGCTGGAQTASGDGVRVSDVDPRTLTFPELGEIALPDVRRVELDNGLTILLAEDRGLPLVQASARIGMGSLWDPADHAGLADLTAETMRSGGAGDLDPDALDAALENVGASVEVFAGDDAASASMTTLAENLDTVLPLFVDVLTRPQFDAEKVALAKTQAKSGISRRNDNPQGIAVRELFERLYAEGSPYAQEPEYYTIDAISRDDVVDFHERYVRPENTLLAVWGDFDAAEMEARLREAFGSWTGSGAPRPEVPAVEFTEGRAVYTVEKDDVNQSTVLIGHPGEIRLDHPDYPAVVVMNQVLGGGFGSRLFQTVRSDLGLAYSVGGSYGADYVTPGVFYASTNTKSESTVEAAQAMLDVIEAMKTTPPTPEELALAKDSYLNSYVFRFDTKGEVLEPPARPTPTTTTPRTSSSASRRASRPSPPPTCSAWPRRTSAPRTPRSSSSATPPTTRCPRRRSARQRPSTSRSRRAPRARQRPLATPPPARRCSTPCSRPSAAGRRGTG